MPENTAIPESEGDPRFYLSEEANTYLGRLNKNSTSGKIQPKLKFWWLCAQVGILSNRTMPCDQGAMGVRTFVPPLDSHSSLIRGILLMEAIQRVDVGDGDERTLVESVMSKHITNSTASQLTHHATKLLDNYSTGGFQVIRDELGAHHELHTFMLAYHELVMRLSAA